MTALEIYLISGHLQGFASLLILLTALVSKKSSSVKEVRIFAVYGLVSFLFYIGQKVSPIQYVNPIGNFFVLFETSMLLLLYYSVIWKKWMRHLLVVVAAGFYVFFISYLFSEQKGLGAGIRSYRDLAMIVFSIAYFGLLLNKLVDKNLVKLPIFWINSAILFFFSCTLMLSLSMTYIAEVLRDDFAIFWAFRNFLRVGFCLVLCIGIWKSRKRTHQFK